MSARLRSSPTLPAAYAHVEDDSVAFVAAVQDVGSCLDEVDGFAVIEADGDGLWGHVAVYGVTHGFNQFIDLITRLDPKLVAKIHEIFRGHMSGGAAIADSGDQDQIPRPGDTVTDLEGAGRLGVDGLDEEISDLGPGINERAKKMSEDVLAEMQRRYADETDSKVKQDLGILIKTLEDSIRSSDLSFELMLPANSSSMPVIMVSARSRSCSTSPRYGPTRPSMSKRS